MGYKVIGLPVVGLQKVGGFADAGDSGSGGDNGAGCGCDEDCLCEREEITVNDIRELAESMESSNE